MGKSVGKALNTLGWNAALPPDVLLPFFASVWGIVVQDELHLALAAKFLGDGAKHGEPPITQFAGVAVIASVRACTSDDLDSQQWAHLFSCLSSAMHLPNA